MSDSRRRSRGNQEESAGTSNGLGGQNRPERPGDMGDEDDIGAGPSGISEEDNDPTRRREIRSKYRDLINQVQQNREDMLNPANNKLTDVLEEANKLFANVRQAREAALDAQLLVLATDLGKEKASQLHAEGSAFDPSAFAEHLLSFMGLNRLEDESGQDGNLEGYLPQGAWQRLAKRSEYCFKTAPSFHYMLGSFLAEPPPPRQRVERQRKAPSKEAKRIMPTQLKKMEESHQEATEKEVERILGCLQSYFADDSEEPISYYEFVIDPNSFSRTVENIFHTSFLIRDGLVRMYLDTDGLPCIAPVEEGEIGPGGAAVRHQCVISINQESWKEIIDAFDIKEALIPAPEILSQ
ncbi:non-structural maintenance of chromosomes element 4 homolog A-like [Sinocyclocheilus rhinocerous]|uniref:Non-structural maintenance of chromosomes element 4 n=1 Tax=Sinocyclocheilus rhinocerous TaxID=307959 RepID=A0A673HSR8_9TELE|nr:PREDICTED: non-structural maintenance of chromosomes element 4 homolog A-like [Sinocyclocheilus rhinocerous]XP_016367141.1 PREDICTED: non-structural maintenance of chromosomes element 4 homolog A-like [Sinocyclocheilus rhinocerous]